MPTPVQHLVIAADVLAGSELSTGARDRLMAQRGAFLFGTLAPDVQSVSGQAREATHFFTLPPEHDWPAYAAMLKAYPELARPERLSPARAAFIAGYISHLAADELWVASVFGPFFGSDAEWGTFRERLLIHNVLRTWLDRRDQPRLERELDRALAELDLQGWLPFVSDEHLARWRDYIVDELRPGATMRTAEVFAERMRVPPTELLCVLESPGEMERRVFAHLPEGCVDRYYAGARRVGARIIAEYLRGD